MNKIIEEKFIKTFIEKSLQERIIFELFNADEDKRSNAIARFSHEASKYLKDNCIHFASKKLSIDDVEKEIKKLSTSVNNCYVICWNEYDGKTMPLRKALETIWYWGGAAIIVVSDRVAFLKAEQSFGPPMKLILYKEAAN